jgi:MSHA biogenesis protein MshO
VALEFLQTEGTARYYGAGENPSAAEDLTTGASVSGFGTVNAFDSAATASYSAPYLAVGNLGPGTPNDAYAAGSGVMTAGVTIVVPPPMPLVTGENQVNLSGPMTFAADGISAHNAYLVSGPVSYVCDTSAAAGTLTRYSGYALTSVEAVPPSPATAALIAHDVSKCTFSYVKDPSHRFGEIAILDVTLSSGGESFQLFLEAPTEYSQ